MATNVTSVMNNSIVVPCRARGMPADHNFQNAYFVINSDTKHGDELVCSYPACKDAGVKFCYCAYCRTPVARRNFRLRHHHAGDAEPPPQPMLGGSIGIERLLTTEGSSGTTSTSGVDDRQTEGGVHSSSPPSQFRAVPTQLPRSEVGLGRGLGTPLPLLDPASSTGSVAGSGTNRRDSSVVRGRDNQLDSFLSCRPAGPRPISHGGRHFQQELTFFHPTGTMSGGQASGSNFLTSASSRPVVPIGNRTVPTDGGRQMAATVGATTTATASVASATKEPRIVPCRARGMPPDHTFETAQFVIPPDVKHGDELTCSYPVCRKGGVKFCFCTFCDIPVAKRNFRVRHNHCDFAPPAPNATITSLDRVTMSKEYGPIERIHLAAAQAAAAAQRASSSQPSATNPPQIVQPETHSRASRGQQQEGGEEELKLWKSRGKGGSRTATRRGGSVLKSAVTDGDRSGAATASKKTSPAGDTAKTPIGAVEDSSESSDVTHKDPEPPPSKRRQVVWDALLNSRPQNKDGDLDTSKLKSWLRSVLNVSDPNEPLQRQLKDRVNTENESQDKTRAGNEGRAATTYKAAASAAVGAGPFSSSSSSGDDSSSSSSSFESKLAGQVSQKWKDSYSLARQASRQWLDNRAVLGSSDDDYSLSGEQQKSPVLSRRKIAVDPQRQEPTGGKRAESSEESESSQRDYHEDTDSHVNDDRISQQPNKGKT